MAWDQTTDPYVGGCRTYYGAASRGYTNMVDVGNARNITISGLIGETALGSEKSIAY
jgi:hypothetical protein